MEDQPKKKLPIDLSELAVALQTNSPEIRYYLDLTNGEIRVCTADMDMMLADFLDETDVDTADSAALLQAIQVEEDDMLLEAFLIRQDKKGERFLEVTPDDRRAGYRTMEDFIQTIENRALQNHLANAIRAKGAFRNFKNTLARFPAELDRWYAYKNEREREQALRWLNENGIEWVEAE